MRRRCRSILCLSAIPAIATILHITGRRYACNRSLKQSSGLVRPTRCADARFVRLEYRNVTMRFAETGGRGALTALRDVSFAVRDGEVVSLIGPSGCGKSTLLNIGSGLTAPSEGMAFVDGERVEGPNAHVAFMLQKDLLLPWRTVAENVMFGVEIQGVPLGRTPAARARAAGEFQTCRVLRPLSASIVRRHAAARGAGAHACRRSACACCSTSRSRRSMRKPAWCCSATWRRRSSRPARPRSSSPMILSEAVTLSDRVLVMSRRPGTIIDEIMIDLPQPRRPDRAAPRAQGQRLCCAG